MGTKETLILQGHWDLFNDRPYENRTVQASQSSTLERSIQFMVDLEKEQRLKGQAETRPTSLRSGHPPQPTAAEIQIIKEAFCVIEDMVKYLGTHGHHLSVAYGKGQAYLNNNRQKIS